MRGAAATDTVTIMDQYPENWLSINQANWDERADIHAASNFYQLDSVRQGAVGLHPFEVEEAGEVVGKTLVHLQCHLGTDTLSWARHGARVTGVDFSSRAIEQARALASDAGIAEQSRFVVSDVYTAPQTLDGEKFDIVYTGQGALVWLPDLTRWAQTVAELLKPGGFLYLVEFHPYADCLGEDVRSLEHDYFKLEGTVYDSPWTYTDGPELTNTTSIEWQHPISQVITCLGQAGLRTELLSEYPYLPFRFRQGLVCDQDNGRYEFPSGQPRIPLMYSLRARA
jgi:SAM-dependent methyltransferase